VSDGGVRDSGVPEPDAIVADGPSKSRQTARPIGMPFTKNGYWEYLPPGYGDGTKRPLLVFWHGVGENGSGGRTDLDKVLVHGPPKLINLNQWPSDRPFIVLSPQHAAADAGRDCPTASEIHDFIAFGMTNYDVDPNRVYLTGLSCGALGSSSYLGQFQGQQVVAAVLIAGDSSIAYNAAGCTLLNQVALWALHGDIDQDVPPGPDAMGMAKFMACPGVHKEALYNVLVGADHTTSWTITYDLSAMHDVYSWLLMQHR
jgi:predicted peptidase